MRLDRLDRVEVKKLIDFSGFKLEWARGLIDRSGGRCRG